MSPEHVDLTKSMKEVYDARNSPGHDRLVEKVRGILEIMPPGYALQIWRKVLELSAGGDNFIDYEVYKDKPPTNEELLKYAEYLEETYHLGESEPKSKQQEKNNTVNAAELAERVRKLHSEIVEIANSGRA